MPTMFSKTIRFDLIFLLNTSSQPISAKEEADFRKLLARAEISIGDADKFAEVNPVFIILIVIDSGINGTVTIAGWSKY